MQIGIDLGASKIESVILDYNIDNISNIKSIKWGKLKIYQKQSHLVKFLGLYYVYGEIYKY